MPSKNKLIKQGIKYTDSLFDEISKRLEKGVKASDTLEAFLEKTAGYTSGNPLVESGYYDKMMKLILQETNNHKFSRPAQKELVRLTIENRVGDLIVDVGEDVRDSVREIVKDGYNNNLSQDEIATNISDKVSSIKGKRAKAIARTEIARTATISDYIINKERGATHFYVECRNTACPICKEAWHKHWSKANDESFTPKDSSAGGKGWIGDRTYSMKDTAMLPPIHVNCRCVPYFISEDDVDGEVEPVIGRRPTTTTTETVEEPTNSITDNLTEKELKRYQKAQKDLEKANKMLDKLASDDPRRIMYESRIDDAERTINRLEKMATDPTQREVVEEKIIIQGGKKNTDLDYNKITSNEDIANYFGLTYIEEHTTQYGKTTTRPIFKDEKYNTFISGMENLDVSEVKEVLRSYDTSNPILKSAPSRIYLDPDSKIKELGVYNPGSNTITFYSHQRDLDSNSIKSTVDHELTHAFDCLLNPEYTKFLSQKDKEYRKIVREEGWSSLYSYSTKGATRISEDIAECGSMVLNKNDPNIKIKLQDGEIITAKEWCERFPKKTAYFEKLLKSKEAQSILQNR